MARLPYLDEDDLAPEDQRLLDPPLNIFRVLAYCPAGARAFGRLGLWIASRPGSIRACARWRSSVSAP